MLALQDGMQNWNLNNDNPGTFDNYLHHWVDATAGGRFVPEGITSPVVNTSVLT